MALFFNIKDLNLSDPFMKALKAVNSTPNNGTVLTEEELKKQRITMERASTLAAQLTGADIEELVIDDIACEWVRPTFPHNSKTVILYAHGGGYTVGGLAYARILAAKMAQQTGLEVLTFEYRLAPEYKYPAALDDGFTIYNYLMQKGYGAQNVILAGDSAGGNLVLCMTQRIIADGRIAPKALILYSPWTDMTATSASYEDQKDSDPILTYDYIISVRNAYIGEDADPTLPIYSPLYGDFKNFPPTLIQVGKNEVLQDDSNKLAKKINKAGGNALLQLYKDGWHVFQQMPTPGASRAMNDVGEYISTLLYK